MTTILVTGFGPFPGAPFNPTEALVQRLAQLRRPALANVKIVTHVFPTGYAAVDRDLPGLIAKHKPDALLMFGLATRTPHLRIETRARNALALMPDATGASLRRSAIARDQAQALPMPAPVRHLLAAVRAARVPAALSRDAGRYLCNYLCWRSAEAAKSGGLRIAAFIHVPLIRRGPVAAARAKKRHLALADLERAGIAALSAVAVAARR